MNKVSDFMAKEMNVVHPIFADDTAPIVCAKTTELLVSSLSDTNQGISISMMYDSITINQNKFGFLVFRRSGHGSSSLKPFNAVEIKRSTSWYYC